MHHVLREVKNQSASSACRTAPAGGASADEWSQQQWAEAFHFLVRWCYCLVMVYLTQPIHENSLSPMHAIEMTDALS